MSIQDSQVTIERVDAETWIESKSAKHKFKAKANSGTGVFSVPIYSPVILLFPQEKKNEVPQPEAPRRGLRLVTEEDGAPTYEELLLEPGSEVLIYRHFEKNPKRRTAQSETVAGFLLKDRRVAYVRSDGHLRFRRIEATL